MKQKRGFKGRRAQFYIVAAVIISMVVIGLAVVVNQARKEKTPKTFSDLIEQLGLESSKVIDYGVKGDVDVLSTLDKFAIDYGSYITSEDTNLIFIYGDENTVNAIVYGYGEQGEIGITIGEGGSSITIREETKQVYNDIDISDEQITIPLGEQEYTFDLQKGKNFFFVIKKELEEGDIVQTG